MDREEATEALALLKRVIGQAKDDTTLQNWGWLWVIHGLTNAVAFVATDWLLRDGAHLSPPPYVAIWSVTIGFNFVTIFALKGETARGGVRSFVENQIWVIWSSFILLSAFACILNYRLGLDHLWAGIAMALLAAFAFAMMGGVMGKRWFAWAAVFVGAAALMALALPAWQFTILGVLWAVMQSGGGVMLLLERRRRLAAGLSSPRVV